MKKYPALIIECASHTDSRATNKYNDWLSDRRAKRSMDYILSKGINPKRISAQGYGESQLVNTCTNETNCTEAEHQLNRRTEFKIVNLDEIKDKYPEICLPKSVFIKKDVDLKINTVVENVNDEIGEKSEFKKIGDKTLIKIETIYFDLNSSYLKDESTLELNKVVQIMRKHPALIIECASHTDSRQSNKYCQKGEPKEVLNIFYQKALIQKEFQQKDMEKLN